jgi:hypothetical protein
VKGKSFTTSKNDYRDLEGRDSDSFLLISLQTSLKQGYTAERKPITPFAALSCLLQLLSPFQDLVRRLHGTRKTQNGTPVTHHARLSTMGSLEWSEFIISIESSFLLAIAVSCSLRFAHDTRTRCHDRVVRRVSKWKGNA